MKRPKTYCLPGPLDVDDPRHGTERGYSKGCREACCQNAHARRRNLERLYGPRPLVDATGTRRRIEALACLGWSANRLSLMLGAHKSYLRKVAAKTRVQQATAALVAELYDDLCMTRCTAPQSAQVIAAARLAGWCSPLAWDDASIDDPSAAPVGVRTTADDRHATARVGGHLTGQPSTAETVEAILAGHWTMPCTRADKVEVVSRWLAAGTGSLSELERRTGWNCHRYAAEARARLEGGEAA